MTITVKPGTDSLKVTGDVDVNLHIPMPTHPDLNSLFVVAMSDGTLIDGELDHYGGLNFRIAREGAGITHFDREGGFVHEWKVSWITTAPVANCALVEEEEARTAQRWIRQHRQAAPSFT